jgi:MHS family shikimate/dehydroshikimate transporter-like MFS transporter
MTEIASSNAAMTHTPGTEKVAQTSAVASLIGTFIEWYDFYIYGIAAALVFNTLFFPSYDPTVGTILAFATFAVGSIIRPIGGIVCGHYGDRVGRKKMLVFTLVLMGAATFLMGLLPSYEQIGIWAAIMLIVLRMAQGFAFGGEWGGAVLMSVEHAPKERRGFYGSFPQYASPIGNLVATGSFALLNFLPKDAFMSWGWRVPFLASAAFVIVGLIYRIRLLESPEFLKVVQKKEVARFPIADAFRYDLKPMLVACGIILATVVAFWVQMLFVVSYATQSAGLTRQTVLNAVLIGAAFELVLLPLCAILSDRIGRKPVALAGAIITALSAFPFFWLVDMGTFWSVTAAICLAMLGISPLYAVLPVYVSEMFGARVRYSAISLSYTVASGVVGGITPALAASMYAWAGKPWPVALYLVVIAGITIVSILVAPSVSKQQEATT